MPSPATTVLRLTTTEKLRQQIEQSRGMSASPGPPTERTASDRFYAAYGNKFDTSRDPNPEIPRERYKSDAGPMRMHQEKPTVQSDMPVREAPTLVVKEMRMVTPGQAVN